MSEYSAQTAIIAPSLLSCDFARLADEANRMLSIGADWLHMDVMDGHFVGNLTIGAPVVKSLRSHCQQCFIDCHLMVSNPSSFLSPFLSAGASSFTFHFEALSSTEEVAELAKEVRKTGMKVGVAIKPKTNVEVLFPLLDEQLLDMVLVMTVEPGFGGQKFMGDMMPKVASLRKRYPSLLIQVDGGLNTTTVKEAAKAGANVVVAGSAIFKAEDPKETISQLREAINEVVAK